MIVSLNIRNEHFNIWFSITRNALYASKKRDLRFCHLLGMVRKIQIFACSSLHWWSRCIFTHFNIEKIFYEEINYWNISRYHWLWMTMGLGTATSAKRTISVCPPTRPFQTQEDCICEEMDVKAHKCRCSGPDLVDVPENLTNNLHIL